MMRLTYAPELIEEAVLLAEAAMARDERRAFRGERDPLYEIGDRALCDDRFPALHWRWFVRLGLDRAIEETIAAALVHLSGVEEARVLPATGRHDEGADLVDQVVAGRSAPVPVLVIRLRPAVLLDPATVRAILDHELMHVRDMLDPAFGYQRSLRSEAGGPAETILRDRYRVLWDATIDGRLWRAGLAGGDARATRRREFEATFPMLGAGASRAFDAWFDRGRPTHDGLLAFARMPASVLPDDEVSCDPLGAARSR